MISTSDSMLAMPKVSKTKSLAEVKGKGKPEKKVKAKKPKLSIEILRRIYKLAIDEPLPDCDDEVVERKKLLAAIKKILR